MKTAFDENYSPETTMEDYNYQNELTPRLDVLEGDFTQEIINEIVLWKVNRYAGLSERTLELINQIDPDKKEIDEAFTGEVLVSLLNEKGIRLPMATTILRFKNPNVYAILDRRVYRFVCKEALTDKMTVGEGAAKLYITYLKKLREAALKHNVPFPEADRIFYMEDKRLNKNLNTKNDPK